MLSSRVLIAESLLHSHVMLTQRLLVVNLIAER
jgi:hypothetical protein